MDQTWGEEEAERGSAPDPRLSRASWTSTWGPGLADPCSAKLVGSSFVLTLVSGKPHACDTGGKLASSLFLRA